LLSFATPAWLLGLLLIPVIRWLHRGGVQLRAVPVANLALWRKAATAGPSAGERRPPDPAWRRRALAAALLSVALAGPRSATPVERITLWVDDSLSMLTREADGTRLEVGLATVAAEFASRPRAEIEIRTLGNPWQSHDGLSSGTTTALVRDAGQREPTAAPAGLLRADRRHWLLTDGADAEVLDAAAGIGFSRVFRVGEVTRNAGIVRLSARRSLGERDRLDVELQVSNGGDTAEQRIAILFTESGEVKRASIALEPGASATVSAATPMTSAVQARLEPGDALAADDTMTLDASPLLARRVAADPACPAGIVAALQAHPALSITADAAAAELVVECSGGAVGAVGTSGPATTPRIRFLRERPPVRVEGPLLWASSVSATQRRRVDPLALRARGTLAPPGSGETLLLAAGSMPLIVERRNAGAPLIETVLDAEAADTSRTVAPLLVALLVDRAVSASLLDAVAVTARAARAVAVVPHDVVPSAAADAAGFAPQSRHWMRPLIVLAALVLLWELATLLRRWRRERVEAEAWPG
jgi:hypothetical protein